MISRFISVATGSAFVRNVGMLTSGTVVAQIITLAALPLLTRIYSPEDFSLLAVFSAVLGLVAVVSCFRFNIAIPLPVEDDIAANLLVLSLLAALLVSSLAAIVVVLAPAEISSMLGQPGIAPYLWLVPIGILFAAAYDALQYWASRKRRFSTIMKTRITRAVGGTGTQLFGGMVSPGPGGLILGQVMFSGLGLLGLVIQVLRKDYCTILTVTKASVGRAFKRYKAFPIYSVPEALMSTAALEVSVLVIAAYAAGPEAGYLMLAMRVIGLPMGLIGGSVGQVFLTDAGERHVKGQLGSFTRQTMINLLRLGAPPILAVGLVSPFVFPLIFGDEWFRAGLIVAWLAPMFALQFISSPVSMVPHVLDRLGLAMSLQIVGAVVRIGAIMVSAIIAPDVMVETFAISSAVFYVGTIFFTLWVTAEGRIQ